MLTTITITLLGGTVGLLYALMRAERERAEMLRKWNDMLFQHYRSLEEAYIEQARILAGMIEDGDVTVDATGEPIEYWLN